MEATYREKARKGLPGLWGNVTKTYNPENPVQLITRVQVAPNTTDDRVLLAEALPNLKDCTGVETLITDGGCGSADNDQLRTEHQVTLIQTAIWGRPRGPERFDPNDFQVGTDARSAPERATYPIGAPAAVKLSRSGKAFVAVFAGNTCATCGESFRCPVALRRRSGEWVLRFTMEDLRRAEHRRQARQYQGAGRNLRAAVESTAQSANIPLRAGNCRCAGGSGRPVW